MSYFDNFKTLKDSKPAFTANEPLCPDSVEGDIGLELEMEGTDFVPPEALKYRCPIHKSGWTLHMDGSLRNGVEYVLTRPCDVTSLRPLVEDLYKGMDKAGTNVRNSNRCSTHVHVNVSTWKTNLVTSFLVAWSAIEPALIAWCGIERKSNHFCLGLNDSLASITCLLYTSDAADE